MVEDYGDSVFVDEGEAAIVSKHSGKVLSSGKFRTCNLFLLENENTGEVMMLHFFPKKGRIDGFNIENGFKPGAREMLNDFLSTDAPIKAISLYGADGLTDERGTLYGGSSDIGLSEKLSKRANVTLVRKQIPFFSDPENKETPLFDATYNSETGELQIDSETVFHSLATTGEERLRPLLKIKPFENERLFPSEQAQGKA